MTSQSPEFYQPQRFNFAIKEQKTPSLPKMKMQGLYNYDLIKETENLNFNQMKTLFSNQIKQQEYRQKYPKYLIMNRNSTDNRFKKIKRNIPDI